MRDISARRHEPARYQIRMQGHLASRWAAWFDGMAMTTHADGTTVLEGPVVDQAALHGLLAQLRDVGLPLLSDTQLDTDPRNSSTNPPTASPANPQGD